MSLSAAELEACRRTQEGALPQVGTVKRATKERDATGSWATTYATGAMAIPCRLGLPTDAELKRDAGDRWEGDPRWVLTVPVATVIDAGDRFVIDAGETLDVVGILSAGESWETARRCAVNRKASA